MPKTALTEDEKLNLSKKKLLFNRYVEPGRLCLIEYGPYAGKLCFIVDIITITRVIVDGAGITGVPKTIMPIKRLKLLKQRVKISANSKTGLLRKEVDKSKVLDEFNKSNLGKKIMIKQKRDLATDYERFQIYYANKELKKKMNFIKSQKKGQKSKA
ncbi:60S ribosomal protein L14, putative [Plasmodium berghei]|uniref:60S ribosomal protein L14, putative n=2 Tax=Plasmodium berghei TaxID=5821 RepID=A0A509AL29_PLABA|nr:60S ribosomal protein L14, putative [Plasmodium berghei ANKA]CXI51064.1 60S ribosomal protein L14, putative [Plasmodium berghei]SCL94382.1 60S ribosomal protein L14, putative [Plasmodium berghei]SCM16005.1 60S ribosomal protein L14, putative [Plasmodium berghei]SCM17801.1 60S ribosomal protein L14, putative [Plasmodium berghei]SCN26049.1 60S ribosomal protein L14, putative [Plasmodium berghei]|eukprot:XP_034421930.1 60S ribosomal protein L14, putative [Plasmodium berghei ANKA]